MSDHRTTVCEHGTEISTCRCDSENKTIVVIPYCPYGCDMEGVTALTILQIRQIRSFLMSEDSAKLPPAARSGLQLLVRLNRDSYRTPREENSSSTSDRPTSERDR